MSPLQLDAVERPTFLDRRMDFSREPMPLSWAVNGFAAHDLLTVLAGQTTAGKTQLALQLAAAAVTGDPSLTPLACAEGRALILDAENGQSVLYERSHVAELPLASVDVLNMRGERLDRTEDRERLSETIRQADAGLVILDSLRRLCGPSREDSADDMAAFVGGLQAVARETGSAIVLLHHRSTKGGAATVRGSSAIEDQADLLFTLDRRGASRVLSCSKMRVGAEPAPLHLRQALSPLRLVAGEGGGSVIGDLADQFLGLPAGEYAAADLRASADLTTSARDRRRLSDAMRRLVSNGEYETPSRGQYRRL